jgi:integrase
MARSKSTMFTDTMIKKLKPEESDYTRSEGNGFSVRVYTTGVKTWLYLYAFGGKRRKMNLGQYPDVTLETARGKFEDAKKQVKNGVDPMAVEEQRQEERRKAPTVADLINEYIEKHAKPSKRSWYEDERILKKDALQSWGKRKAADITKRDVVLLLEEIVKRGSPGSANSNFKIIRKMFKFAVQRDILQHTPCEGVVMPAPLNRGSRVLTAEEIKTFWNSLNKCHVSHEAITAIKLILLTGQRPGEVIGMHTSELDGHWWTIPAERSKNKKAHRVYLTNTALELIGNIPADGFIFPSPTNKARPMGRLTISQAVGRNLSWPVLVNGKPVFDKHGKPVTENLIGIADFVPHDLRRTCATFMSGLGFHDEVIDAVLNHTKQGIIRTYNLNRYDKEKQQALETWERKLLSIIQGTENNVIPISRKKAA